MRGDDRDDVPGSAASTGESPTEDTEDTEDTETPGEEIEPADGQQVNTQHLSVNLPEGWRGEQKLSLVTGAAPRGLLATIYINDLQVPGVPASPLAKEARNTVRSLNEERDPEILDPIEVDGVEVYHLAGQVSSSLYVGHGVDLVRVHLLDAAAGAAGGHRLRAGLGGLDDLTARRQVWGDAGR